MAVKQSIVMIIIICWCDFIKYISDTVSNWLYIVIFLYRYMKNLGNKIWKC